MSEDQATKVFYEVHDDIPRGGPGGSESTGKAFRMLTQLPKQPTILDIGCGPGMQTLDLASLTEGKIIALDNHRPFLERLQRAVEQRNLGSRISVVNGDMFVLDFGPGTFDLIWAEGSAYIMGFEKALRAWKNFLKKHGYIAVTEVAWLKTAPPEELRSFWAKEYPSIQDAEANLNALRRSGYDPVGHFTLPESDWWDHYYTPIEAKLEALQKKYKDSPDALKILETEKREIDIYRRYSDYYGYVFYIGQAQG